MERQYIARTQLKGLRRLRADNTSAHDAWTQIEALLRKRLGDAHANLLAEPVSVGDGLIDWYGGTGEDLRPLSALGETEHAALLQRFHALKGDIEALAAQLREGRDADQRHKGAILEHALRFAHQPDEAFPLYSVGGEPVLVGWGTRLDNDAPYAEPIPPDPIDVPGVARPPNKDEEAPQQPVHIATAAASTWDWRSMLAWLLFALLTLLLFLRLLPPCGLAGLTGERQCPQVTLTDSPGDPAPLLAAQQRVAALEDALANAPLCSRPGTQAGVGASEADRRRTEAGGQSGELTITLTWNGTEDLDLHVICPAGGEIFFRNKTACGGELDVDRNSNAALATSQPVENVVFKQAPAPGHYAILVHKYPRQTQLAGESPVTAFEVQVIWQGQRQTYPGQVAKDERLTVTTIDVP